MHKAHRCFAVHSLLCHPILTGSRSLKANPSSIVSTTVDEMTGEEKKRLVNRFRWKGYGPATIMFSDANV